MYRHKIDRVAVDRRWSYLVCSLLQYICGLALLLSCIIISCSCSGSKKIGVRPDLARGSDNKNQLGGTIDLCRAQAIAFAIDALKKSDPLGEFAVSTVTRNKDNSGWLLFFKDQKKRTVFGASRLVSVTDSGNVKVFDSQ